MTLGFRHYTVAVGTTTSQALGPNPRRTMILISAPSSAGVSVFFGEPATMFGALHFPFGSYPPRRFVFDNGDAFIRHPMHVIAAIDTTIGITEVFEG